MNVHRFALLNFRNCRIELSHTYASKNDWLLNTQKDSIDKSLLSKLINLSNYNSTRTHKNLYLLSSINLLFIELSESKVQHTATKYRYKFLEIDSERAKIHEAKKHILKNISTPISIKQLSKKVAINDCYLKQGFRALYGKTIKEFYQEQRMNYAKSLLYEKGLSVTDVSNLLGFSSISHFSSSFKKYTGIKPCELLFKNYSSK